jgi:hypothetical protein
MAQPSNDQTITAPYDLLQSLLNDITNLRNDSKETKDLIAHLSKENKETKDLLTTLLAITSPTQLCGAFSVFPKLPVEIRNMIWDAALRIPRIVGAKIVVRDRGKKTEDLVPTAPNSSMLFVNQEARYRAKKLLVCFTDNEERGQDRVPLLYLNPQVDTLWIVNYTPNRARQDRITDSVVFARKIRKIAIPLKLGKDSRGGTRNGKKWPSLWLDSMTKELRRLY